MSKIGERIAKTIANTGSCSRRDAEKWILGGRVKVNGVVINSPALNVTETDIILIDDKLIPKGNPIRLWKFHKPVGYITSHKDPQHRPTLFSLLPPDFPRVISVGRLDMDSQGLILLTNNGEIAHKLENPSLGIPKKYRIRVRGTIDQRILDDLKQGIKIDDFQYKPADAQLEKQDGKFAWLNITITEGKNREIRKIFDHLDWPVNKLIRLSFGPFKLDNLSVSSIEEININDCEFLRNLFPISI